MSSINNRIVAKEWVDGIMKVLPHPEADTPYLKAVLVEAVLFEEPLKQLEVGPNQVGSFYNITIKGYENLIDMVRWANTFMGVSRNPLLCHVTHCYVQLTDKGAIMVIQMNKVEFHTAGNAEEVDEEAPLTKGGRGSVIPRRFKKRTE